MNEKHPSDYFKEKQLEKRTKFHELIHAAFILGTSVSFYLTRPKPTESDLQWLGWTYPNSKVETGYDQGAKFTTITPKL